MSVSIVLEVIAIAIGQSVFLVGGMFMPAIGALITKRRYFAKEKNAFGFRKVKLVVMVQSLIFPLIYLGVPYFLCWICNPSTVKLIWNGDILSQLLGELGTSLVLVLGEEIGWRGFLLPKLHKALGARKALLYSGVIWGIWHCPMILGGVYFEGIPVLYAVCI